MAYCQSFSYRYTFISQCTTAVSGQYVASSFSTRTIARCSTVRSLAKLGGGEYICEREQTLLLPLSSLPLALFCKGNLARQRYIQSVAFLMVSSQCSRVCACLPRIIEERHVCTYISIEIQNIDPYGEKLAYTCISPFIRKKIVSVLNLYRFSTAIYVCPSFPALFFF